MDLFWTLSQIDSCVFTVLCCDSHSIISLYFPSHNDATKKRKILIKRLVLFKLLHCKFPMSTSALMNKFEYINILDLFHSSECSITKPTHLKYFKLPGLSAYPLDLAENAAEYIHRNVDPTFSLLHFIEHYIMQKKPISSAPEISMKVYAQRSTIINIMSLAVRSSGKLTVNITRFRNGFYISAQSYNKDKNLSSKFHHKLVQLCFSDSTNAAPFTSKPVNENEQYWGIFRAQLGHSELIYSAEVLGVDAEEDVKDLSDLEELNQCRFVLLRLSHRFERINNPLRTFLQAKLVNVEHIYIAKKDNDGVVAEQLRRVDIKTLIDNSATMYERCSTFLLDFLTLVERKMQNVDCPNTVFQFIYVPERKEFELKKFIGKNKYTFLGNDFVEFILQNESFYV